MPISLHAGGKLPESILVGTVVEDDQSSLGVPPSVLSEQKSVEPVCKLFERISNGVFGRYCLLVYRNCKNPAHALEPMNGA